MAPIDSSPDATAGLESFLREVLVLRERIADPTVYPFNIPAVRTLERLPLHPHVTFFVVGVMMYLMRSPADAVPECGGISLNRIWVSTSSNLRSVCPGPRRNWLSARLRLPAVPAISTSASSASNGTTASAAGDAFTTFPPIVAILRI